MVAHSPPGIPYTGYLQYAILALYSAMSKNPRISIVAAVGRNRVIGKDNELLWHIPDDLRRFKQLTFGHPVIMGRKTFESIVSVLGTPLPGRTNIVVTRDRTWAFPDERVLVTHSIEEAIEKASELDLEEIFIGGGGEIWRQSLARVDRLYLTLIDDEKESDAFFPPYETLFPHPLNEEKREYQGVPYRWVTLER